MSPIRAKMGPHQPCQDQQRHLPDHQHLPLEVVESVCSPSCSTTGFTTAVPQSMEMLPGAQRPMSGLESGNIAQTALVLARPVQTLDRWLSIRSMHMAIAVSIFLINVGEALDKINHIENSQHLQKVFTGKHIR